MLCSLGSSWRCLPPGKMQIAGYLLSDRVLNREDIGDGIVIFGGPQACTIADPNQLKADANSLSCLLDRTVEHAIHLQFPPSKDRGTTDLRVFQDGRRRPHNQTPITTEIGDNRIGNAGSQVIIGAVRT